MNSLLNTLLVRPPDDPRERESSTDSTELYCKYLFNRCPKTFDSLDVRVIAHREVTTVIFHHIEKTGHITFANQFQISLKCSHLSFLIVSVLVHKSFTELNVIRYLGW